MIATKAQYQQIWDAMQDTVNRWTPKATNTLSQHKKLRQQIEATEEEMEDILMEGKYFICSCKIPTKLVDYSKRI